MDDGRSGSERGGLVQGQWRGFGDARELEGSCAARSLGCCCEGLANGRWGGHYDGYVADLRRGKNWQPCGGWAGDDLAGIGWAGDCFEFDGRN